MKARRSGFNEQQVRMTQCAKYIPLIHGWICICTLLHCHYLLSTQLLNIQTTTLEHERTRHYIKALMACLKKVDKNCLQIYNFLPANWLKLACEGLLIKTAWRRTLHRPAHTRLQNSSVFQVKGPGHLQTLGHKCRFQQCVHCCIITLYKNFQKFIFENKPGMSL